MKTTFLSIAILAASLTATVNPANASMQVYNDTVVVNDTVKQKEMTDMEKELDQLSSESKKDTTKLRFGKMKLSVVEDGDEIIINKDKDSDWEDWDEEWNWDGESDGEGDHKSHKKSHTFDGHWAGIGLGMNNFLDANQKLEIPEAYKALDINTNKSVEFNLNIADFGVNIIRNYVGLYSGVGFKWNNYRFSNSDIHIIKGADSLEFVTKPNQGYTKSKLSACYLTVPLMLEFQVPIDGDPLYLGVGVEGYLKLTAKHKMKTENGDKSKYKNDYYIRPYNYALTARLGYDDFGLYASYTMESFFRDNKGPELYPFTLGVSLNF